MRIALVATGGFDASGRERVIPALLWLTERLARRHDVAVYVLNYLAEPRSYQLAGATIHDLGRPLGMLRSYRALVRALRRDGPFDVLHAYWAVPAGLAGGLAARRLGIPVVLTLDSGELVALPDIGYGLQRGMRSRGAVSVAVALASTVTVSTRYMEALAAAHGIRPRVIPIGVDTQLFRPGWRPPPPPWRLLHVASLNPVKDQHTLLEAFRLVRERAPGCQLDIVGEDTMRGALHSRAETLGLSKAVVFHGFLPSEELVALYQQAHAFVLSSRHEAANVAVLEAAACGTPVVGTRVGHLADWTFVPTVAPADPHALARAILDVLDNSSRAAAIAEAARHWAATHDADWTAAAFERVYQELAGAATTPPPHPAPAP
jgi:glycosyltransferase involved in cell wall biosynthesis